MPLQPLPRQPEHPIHTVLQPQQQLRRDRLLRLRQERERLLRLPLLLRAVTYRLFHPPFPLLSV